MRRFMLLASVLAVASAMAVAAPPKPVVPDGKGQVILSWDEFVKITGFDPSKKPDGQDVLTVPWAEVKKLLGVKVDILDKDTVDLPWQEFKKLLEWSVQRKVPKPDVPPPTDYIVASSHYEGKLSADGATFTMKVALEILRKKGWKRIPVLPSTVAVTRAKLPEGVHLNSTGGNYEILTEKSGSVPIELDFAVAVRKSAGTNHLNFRPILATSSVLNLTVAGDKVDVKVAGAQSLSTTDAKDQTVVAAALPSGVPVDVTWERALPPVKAAPTKLYAETRVLISVAEGVLLCQETVNFNILHTAVRELKLQVPQDVSILVVAGSGVQDWRVDDKGVLAVTFRGETIGSYSLRIAYERAVKDKTDAPVIRAVGVEREKGFVGVVALANVEVSTGARLTGATSLDVRQLPADIVAMTNQPILLAFRYVADKFTIPLTIKKHEAVGVLVTVVDNVLFTGMQLNDGRRMTKAVYSVRNNRNQFLRLKMPTKVDIWSVSVAGNTVAPAKDEQGSLLIPLVRSKSGARELASFPVELVYVETPEKQAASKGIQLVELPTCGVPAIHVMYNYYLPVEGEYTVGWGKSGFSGALRLVESFTSLSSGPGAEVIRRNVAAQAAQMQKSFDRKVDAQATAAGVTPIRVRLPINGKLFKLEKILAMPKDRLFFQVQYRDWNPPK